MFSDVSGIMLAAAEKVTLATTERATNSKPTFPSDFWRGNWFRTCVPIRSAAAPANAPPNEVTVVWVSDKVLRTKLLAICKVLIFLRRKMRSAREHPLERAESVAIAAAAFKDGDLRYLKVMLRDESTGDAKTWEGQKMIMLQYVISEQSAALLLSERAAFQRPVSLEQQIGEPLPRTDLIPPECQLSAPPSSEDDTAGKEEDRPSGAE